MFIQSFYTWKKSNRFQKQAAHWCNVHLFTFLLHVLFSKNSSLVNLFASTSEKRRGNTFHEGDFPLPRANKKPFHVNHQTIQDCSECFLITTLICLPLISSTSMILCRKDYSWTYDIVKERLQLNFLNWEGKMTAVSITLYRKKIPEFKISWRKDYRRICYIVEERWQLELLLVQERRQLN